MSLLTCLFLNCLSLTFLFSVDATDKHGKGRLVNDYHIAPNCKMIIVCKLHQSKPYLCLFATKDIPAETELWFDYGVANLPWRKKPLEGKEKMTVPLHHSLDELSFCGFKKLISEPQPDEVTSNSGEQSEVLISEPEPDEVTSNSGEQSEVIPARKLKVKRPRLCGQNRRTRLCGNTLELTYGPQKCLGRMLVKSASD
ncbi:uncharacterized protein [Apostichopus japonicus]|uniref:uncharacterized protein isoform X2 n=1 Tax=Stichopus japonicus TaxID=307972 RepID=UPI003AB89FFE